MSLSVRWSARARRDFIGIIKYIKANDAAAASKIAARIERAVERISLRPLSHRPGRVDGTREAVVHTNYIVVYAVGAKDVTVLRVVHARRRYP